MLLKRITDASSLDYARIRILYATSFPYHEQREAASQAAILADPCYHFCAVYDESTLVGAALFWETDKFLYVEHLCVDPTLRNRRYGQKILALLAARGKTVILEIDPPIDEISIRRLGFYERNGFLANPYPHTHPPYHKEVKPHALVVMSAPEMIDETLYVSFKAMLEDRIMKAAF